MNIIYLRKAAISESSYREPEKEAEPLTGDDMQQTPYGPTQSSPSEATLLQQVSIHIYALDIYVAPF